MENNTFYKIIIIIIVCVFMFGGTAKAQESASIGIKLTGKQILDIPVFVCDGQLHPVDMVATENMLIYQARIWVGMTMGGRGDVFYILKNYTTGDIIAQNNWDHYADPVGISDTLDDISFSPNYILVSTGDTIRLNAKCNTSDSVLPHVQVSAVVWYP